MCQRLFIVLSDSLLLPFPFFCLLIITIMPSILSSQGVVLATAMAAVSGTVILLAAFRHQKSSLSSSDGNKRLKSKNKKRVHFAEDVVEPSGDGVEFRKRHGKQPTSSSSNLKYCNSSEDDDDDDARPEGKITGMPANRVALYNGMLRDRVGHRLGYSY